MPDPDLYAIAHDAELPVAAAALAQGDVTAAVTASRRRHDAILAATTRAVGAEVACRRGCAWCCSFRVAVRADEAILLAEHLRANVSPERHAEIAAAVTANAARLARMTAERRMRTNVACPLLVDGACSVYEVRPHTCRAFHATDAEGCEASWVDPERSDIPSASVPALDAVSAGHNDALLDALEADGRDVEVYELNAALAQAIADPAGARARCAAGGPTFPGARFED